MPDPAPEERPGSPEGSVRLPEELPALSGRDPEAYSAELPAAEPGVIVPVHPDPAVSRAMLQSRMTRLNDFLFFPSIICNPVHTVDDQLFPDIAGREMPVQAFFRQDDRFALAGMEREPILRKETVPLFQIQFHTLCVRR